MKRIHELYSPRHSPGQNTGAGSLRFSRGLSQRRPPALQADSLPAEPQREPKNTGAGSLSLLQGIFLTQEANWGLLHCRQILYQLSYQGCKWPFFLYPLWSLLHTGGYRERGSKLSGFSSFKTF